jgi:hypothetical protein
MKLINAQQAKTIKMHVGDKVTLLSLREPVAPPYIMLKPFIEMPVGILVEAQRALPGEGLHGVDYDIKATAAGRGELILGFKDRRTNKVTHEKRLLVDIRE